MAGEFTELVNDLGYAKTFYPNSRVTQYLNGLASRIYLGIYKNKKEETTSRLVEQIGLIFYAFGWHMIAWCQKRNDYRDFKVQRIIKLKSTDIPFRKKDHLPLQDYMPLLPVNY